MGFNFENETSYADPDFMMEASFYLSRELCDDLKTTHDD
jgi:hypothetical protein